MSSFKEHTIQNAAIEWLQSLGYIHQEGKSIDRDLKKVILEDELIAFLQRTYTHVPRDILQDALGSFLSQEGMDLDNRNREFHLKMTKGISITWKDKDGKEYAEHIYPINYNEPNKNVFKCVDEFSIIGNGISEVKKEIPVALKISELTNLGIVVDADSDIKAIWNALKAILKKSGYKKLPASPKKGGTIIQEKSLPKVGIWIMPDNKSTGYLEHFVATLVPQKDELMPIAQKITQEILDKKIKNSFLQKDKGKADIHIWLALQKSPGTPMGSAINFGYLDAKSESALPFIDWMKATFEF